MAQCGRRSAFLIALICASQLIATPASDEAQIWNLEKAYWEYVKVNELEKYRTLRHDYFVGWASVSSEPVRKDHISDWIMNNTSKGLVAIVLN